MNLNSVLAGEEAPQDGLGALLRPVPRDPAYNYGSILPFRKPKAGGPAQWHPLYSDALAGLVNAFTAPGRAYQGQPVDMRDAMNIGLGAMGTNAAVSPMMAPQGGLGALVFHGSPHKFDKFSLSKVGTGEGAQGYGHGLYFADNPGVAANYKQGGGVYKVDLPDTAIARMLEWDKPLSKQNEQIRQALSGANNPLVREALERDWTGQKLVTTLGAALSREQQVPGMPMGVTQKIGGPQAASELLRAAGIPGIRYLDAGSRGTGAGTSNYVVFDEALPTIMGR